MRHSAMIVAAILAVAACGDSDASPNGAARTLPDGLQRLLDEASPGQWRSTGDDRFEVWICHVPHDTTADVYGGLPLRVPLTPDGVVSLLGDRVTPYFADLSNGRYRPVFVAGGELSLMAGETPLDCVDRAVRGASDDAEAVLAVADAEHDTGQHGGFGRGGEPCPGAGSCAVALTRRVAYVGASDFHPDWGEHPPMDLIEHEIGHTLGWAHSGYVEAGDPPYQSGLDLMSDSAAPRAVDPARRDGPGTLALNRLLAGWLPLDDVVAAGSSGITVDLQPSAGEQGLRLVVVGLDDHRFLTVELLTADGLDAHLPADGVAVHLVVVDPDGTMTITPLNGRAPYVDLLRDGDSLERDGWRVTAGPGGKVTVGLAVAP